MKGSFLSRLSVWAAVAAIALGGAASAQEDTDPTRLSSGLVGNPLVGATLFTRCASCHEIGPAARHKTGPALNGLLGREIGLNDGFETSIPMVYVGMLGEVWTADRLDSYLERPDSFMTDELPMSRSSTSPFIGMSDPQQRADIIAYLLANGEINLTD